MSAKRKTHRVATCEDMHCQHPTCVLILGGRWIDEPPKKKRRASQRSARAAGKKGRGK